ncbi:MAG: N-acetylglucosamine-6-phosphate deacetylase [Clostridia bacterium]|nr:N-acetylglucosamine-6-phosphate deacetylase [Clostridia bacterium]
MKTALCGAGIILPDGIVYNQALLMEDGVILGVCGHAPEDAQVIRLDGGYLSPGFVDLHVHGGNGADFMDGTPEAFLTAARNSLMGGATTIYPTTVCSSDAVLLRTFDVFRAVQGREGLPHMPGLHLEGPYFSAAQAGAQDPGALKRPTPEHYRMILENSDIVARVSAACELEGALELGDALCAHGILASIGHSDAEYDEVLRAVRHGYRHVTHLYSCMSSLHRKNAYRVLGVVESAYLLPELTVEIIADGRHLPPELLRMIVKCKDKASVSLVTDALRGSGLPEGSKIPLGGGDTRYAIIENGVAIMPDRSCFCGSVTTANGCVRTMWKDVGLPLHEAAAMMTANPCRVMGLDKRKGRIAPGMDADLVHFDEDVQIRNVWLMGRKAV